MVIKVAHIPPCCGDVNRCPATLQRKMVSLQLITLGAATALTDCRDCPASACSTTGLNPLLTHHSCAREVLRLFLVHKRPRLHKELHQGLRGGH